jgi:polysaccharide pyruvyl transferase WcaK-like protein
MENYLAYVEYGQAHGKKTIGLGLGEQGIITRDGEKRYREAFNNMDLLTVRSKLDKARLDKFGTKTAQATQDVAFSFDYSKFTKLTNKNKQKINLKPKLGVILSNQEHLVNDLKLAFSKDEKVNALNFKNSFEKHLDQLADQYHITIITQSRDDLEMAQEYTKNHQLKIYSYKKIKDLSKLLKTYAAQDLILTQRFHGIIFSFMLGLPVIALGYHGQKQYKLLKDIGIDKKLIMYHDPKKLEKLLSDLVKDSKNASKYSIILNHKNMKFIEDSSRQNLEKLKSLLN